jgi:sucrose-6-phosphate hydrolase SacC (GH32 family)
MIVASLKLQDAATSGNGAAVDLRGEGSLHVFYVSGTGTITAGAVQFETAKSPDYTGTWSPLGVAVAPVSSQEDAYAFAGAYRALRARISTAVTGGGSTTVKLVSTE